MENIMIISIAVVVLTPVVSMCTLLSLILITEKIVIEQFDLLSETEKERIRKEGLSNSDIFKSFFSKKALTKYRIHAKTEQEKKKKQ